MSLYNKKELDNKDSINLLTSLLVRYPEVCTIKYYPLSNLFKLIFIFKCDLNSKILKQFKNELLTCINTYHYFEKNNIAKLIKIKYDYNSGFTVMELTRDTITLTQKELTLIVYLLHNYFDNLLLSEESYVYKDDNYVEQDDNIRQLLDNLQHISIKNTLIALRKEGRVLVFKQ